MRNSRALVVILAVCATVSIGRADTLLWGFESDDNVTIWGQDPGYSKALVTQPAPTQGTYAAAFTFTPVANNRFYRYDIALPSAVDLTGQSISVDMARDPGTGYPRVHKVLLTIMDSAGQFERWSVTDAIYNGGTSFDAFSDFAERGERFRELVEAL